ncbi:MAG TPA: TonB-dependent receptor [Usitatibacter sp.]|jgi:iron complex outermembrane receptor protein|nr:TonB-dependent receptor [Usitatibacter sp.]
MKLKVAVAAALAAGVGTAPVLAQQAPQQKERIEVTGSSIKRIDAETALPVQIITHEDIERTGASTTEELLKTVTAITGFGSVVVAQANGTITTSQSNISLRALGATRTLVLVNGRRVTVFGGTTAIAVDVNSIPLAAIERIEVLKDGASSLYGSDAIAGVVNFILRKDFHGADVSVSYGAPTRSGGGSEKNITAFAGFGDPDRYNVTLGIGYKKIDEIMGSDRSSFAHNINVGQNNDLSSTIAFPGNILYGPNFARLASPAFPNCGPTGIVSPFFNGNINSGQACRFENSPFLSVQPETENKFALLNGRLRLTSQVDAYFESGFTRNSERYHTQPVPVAENTQLPTTNPYIPFINNLIATQYPNLAAGLRRFATLGDTLVLLPTTSPFYPRAFVASLGLPTDQPIAFRYRDFVQGLRLTEDSADTSRVLAGVKGTAGAWDFDSGILYSESKAKSNLISGYPLTSAFLELLDTGVINPFGPTTDPAALAAADAAQFRGTVYSSKTSMTSADAKLSRELFQLRGGPVGIAFGGELREEKFVFDPSQAFQVGDIGGFGGNVLSIDRKRHVSSVYTEVAAPIFRSFEADVGVRYDNYQNIGSTTNPKFSFRWTPNQQVLVRGSVGSGFRAPSLTDLYTPQAASVTANGTRDPLRCPNPATGLPADCNNQFATITGGNPDLKPEKSLSRTLGVIFEPSREFSLGVDAFWINLKDSITIGGLNPAFILANAANAQQFSSFIVRGAPDGNASGLGPITGIIATTSNLFKQYVAGYDVNVLWRVFKSGNRSVVLKLDGTYLAAFDQQNPDGSYTSGLDRALRAGGGVVPRWHHVASAVYTAGAWEGTLIQNYQKHYADQLSTFNPAPREVASYETYDAQVAYRGIRNVRLGLGVKNILDRDPPYTNAGGQFAAGYDVTYADVRGRFVYGTVNYSFR